MSATEIRSKGMHAADLSIAIEAPDVRKVAIKLRRWLRERWNVLLMHDRDGYHALVPLEELHEIRAEIDLFLSGDV